MEVTQAGKSFALYSFHPIYRQVGRIVGIRLLLITDLDVVAWLPFKQKQKTKKNKQNNKNKNRNQQRNREKERERERQKKVRLFFRMAEILLL